MSKSFEVEIFQEGQFPETIPSPLDEYRWQRSVDETSKTSESVKANGSSIAREKNNRDENLEYINFSPVVEQSLKQKEESSYREWYQARENKNVDHTQRLLLADRYLRAFGEPVNDESAARVRGVRDWLSHELKRPFVEINLTKNFRDGKAPTPEEIGNKVADALGFSQDERILYASLKKSKTTGEAFFLAADANTEGANWLKLAAQDPMGRVRVGEIKPGAIAEIRQWLLDFRSRHSSPDAVSKYDYDGQRTVLEAVVAHVYNPIAGGVGAAMGSIGDVVQGLGMPLHAIYNRTFMDELADNLRKEGRGLPMYSLYTKGEMNEALVGLANMYAQAGGSVLPYMGPGLLARGAALTPRAVGLVGQLIGFAGTTGQVYDTALEIQAAEIARKEGVTDESALSKRIEQIKKGESIASASRAEIETRSLVAAALSAPSGIVQGKYLKSLCGHIAQGTPAEQIPRTLLKEIATSLVKGGTLSTAQFAHMQATLFVSGVQGGEQSVRNAVAGAPESFLKGAMLSGSAEALRLTKERIQAAGAAQAEPRVPPQAQPGVAPEEAPKMQPQLQQQQQSRAWGNPQELQQMRARQEQQQRAHLELQMQQQGFQHAAGDASVRILSGPQKFAGRPEARDHFYQSNDVNCYLRYSEGWYHGKTKSANDVVAPLKVHVLTNSPADLKALQKVLIPALVNDPQLRGVVAWKTMDPMEGFTSGKYPPNGIGQDSKAFTIYASTSREAAHIHGRIDQILTNRGLRVSGQIAHQTTDLPTGNSNRVALTLDHFERTVTSDNRPAAVVDWHVEQALKHFNGVPSEYRFSDHQLRKLEADCGMQPRILSYDAYGRLSMSLEGNGAPIITNDRIYVSESGAQHVWGAMTGRYAIYSLYRRANIEPARAELLR